LLRAGELRQDHRQGRDALALTDSRIATNCRMCKTSRFLKQVVNFDGTSNHDADSIGSR